MSSKKLSFGSKAATPRPQQPPRTQLAWNESLFPDGTMGKLLYRKDEAVKVWRGLNLLAREWGVLDDALAAEFAGMKAATDAEDWECAQNHYYRIQGTLLQHDMKRNGHCEDSEKGDER